MSDVIKKLSEDMNEILRIEKTQDGFFVTTGCMYPSNGLVRVLVRGGKDEFVVSDEGEAIKEAESSGMYLQNPDRRLLGVVKGQGLLIKNGVIHSPRVTLKQLVGTVIIVANASKEASHRCYDHGKLKITRNFKEALSALLEKNFGDNITKNTMLIGASNKTYKFDHVIKKDDLMITVDPVVREPSAINARVVANMDIKNAGNDKIIQTIVYDDYEEWNAADLNLLRMASRVLPFESVRQSAKRLIA